MLAVPAGDMLAAVLCCCPLGVSPLNLQSVRCMDAGNWLPVSLLTCLVQAEAKAAGELVTDNVEVQRMMQQAGKVGNPAGGAQSGCRGRLDLLVCCTRGSCVRPMQTCGFCTGPVTTCCNAKAAGHSVTKGC